MLSKKQRTIRRTTSYANASLFCTAEIANHAGELARRCDAIGSSDFHRRLWPSINDRAVAILKHGQPASRANTTQALRAVATHARENNTDRLTPEYFRDRCEQRVSGRPHAPHRR